jgi:hypothetical protein
VFGVGGKATVYKLSTTTSLDPVATNEPQATPSPILARALPLTNTLELPLA